MGTRGQFELTAKEFERQVPAASRPDGRSGVWTMNVDGVAGRVRVRRAAETANQIHVAKGEPVVAHVPHDVHDEWYCLPLSWLLRYAVENEDSVQHAKHSVECLMIPRERIPSEFRVPSYDLQEACESAIRDARSEWCCDQLAIWDDVSDQVDRLYADAASRIRANLT